MEYSESYDGGVLEDIKEHINVHAVKYLIAAVIIIVILLVWAIAVSVKSAESMGNAVAAQQMGQGYFGESFVGGLEPASPFDLKPSKDVIIDGHDAGLDMDYRLADTDIWREGYKAGEDNSAKPWKPERPKFFLLRDVNNVPIRDNLGFVMYTSELAMQSSRYTNMLPADSAIKLLRTKWDENNLRAFAGTCKPAVLLDSDPYSWLQKSGGAAQNIDQVVQNEVASADVSEYKEGMRVNAEKFADSKLLPAAYGENVSY